MADRELDAHLAEAMGWPKLTRGQMEPLIGWFDYVDFIGVRQETPFGNYDIKRFSPSSDPAAFRLVEDRIEELKLGGHYVSALGMALWPVALAYDPFEPFRHDEVWQLMRAPLEVKARAALQVLREATP